MKRYTFKLLALGAALLTAGYVVGQSQSKSTDAAPAPKQMKLVKVATLTTTQANQEFQANVQLLQAQRAKALELNADIEKEKDSAKKKDLQKELDTLMTRLNENNQQMSKIYGFSLTRNYTMEIEKSNIYMLVSEEEAAQIEKSQKEQEKTASKKK